MECKHEDTKLCIIMCNFTIKVVNKLNLQYNGFYFNIFCFFLFFINGFLNETLSAKEFHSKKL